MGKNLPTVQAMQEIQVQYLGREDPLEKGQVTHSSIHRLSCGSTVKNPPTMRRPGFDPWVALPGGGRGNPL